MIRRLLVLLALALGGCCGIPIGEETFTVSGRAPPNATVCDIYLRTEAGDEVPSTRRTVSGPFREQFPVTTCGATHRIVVTCDGVERQLVAVRDYFASHAPEPCAS